MSSQEDYQSDHDNRSNYSQQEDEEMVHQEEQEEEVVSEQDSILSEDDEESRNSKHNKHKKYKKQKNQEQEEDQEEDEEMDTENTHAKNDRSQIQVTQQEESRSQSCITTRRSRYDYKEEDHEMKSQSSSSTKKDKDSQSKKHKKKKKKKDKKKKKKKDKKKKKKKKKRGSSTTSESSNSSESDGDWKFDDKGVNYGSPEKLSEGSSDWDGRSQELYDSDNPECPLNLYHQNSKPRILELQDLNDQGEDCKLILDCLTFNEDEDPNKKKKDKDKMTYSERRREQEYSLMFVDHKEYQNRQLHGLPEPLVLHNMISQDFIRGVSKNLTCPICQEMVNNPVIYKVCLHRFCSQCIESYNRLGKKECPLCRKSIGNRRQLRDDKNIKALMETLRYDFIKLQKQEELENQEIKRKIMLEQKLLKEKKEKQKRVIVNEMRRKYSESAEEKKERMAKEREESSVSAQLQKKKSKGSAGFGGTDGGVDTNHVIRMIEEKKANLPNILLPVDIEITITHDKDQNDQFKMMVQRIRLKAHRSITLIHLGILVAHKNLCKEDEWPNFEFYPCSNYKDYLRKNPEQPSNWKDNGRPFRFKMTIYEIIKEIYPGQEDHLNQLELVYKKKQLPNMNPKLNNITKTTSFNNTAMNFSDMGQSSFKAENSQLSNGRVNNGPTFNYFPGFSTSNLNNGLNNIGSSNGNFSIQY